MVRKLRSTSNYSRVPSFKRKREVMAIYRRTEISQERIANVAQTCIIYSKDLRPIVIGKTKQ